MRKCCGVADRLSVGRHALRDCSQTNCTYAVLADQYVSRPDQRVQQVAVMPGRLPFEF